MNNHYSPVKSCVYGLWVVQPDRDLGHGLRETVLSSQEQHPGSQMTSKERHTHEVLLTSHTLSLQQEEGPIVLSGNINTKQHQIHIVTEQLLNLDDTTSLLLCAWA